MKRLIASLVLLGGLFVVGQASVAWAQTTPPDELPILGTLTPTASPSPTPATLDPTPAAVPEPSSATIPFHVCIDPGHGGERATGGYNQMHTLHEDTVALDMSFRLQSLLESAGYSVTITRTETDDNPSFWDRVSLCRSNHADILVSMHVNATHYDYFDGTTTLYYYHEDIPLAEAIHDPLVAAIATHPDTTWDIIDMGVRRRRSGLLRRWFDGPGVIVEPAFLTHNGQAELLLNDGPDSRRQLISQAVFDGIQAYYADIAGLDVPTPLP